MKYREYLKTIHIPKLLRKQKITDPIMDKFDLEIFDDIEDSEDFLMGRALFIDRQNIFDEIDRVIHEYSELIELMFIKWIIDITGQELGCWPPVAVTYDGSKYILTSHCHKVIRQECPDIPELEFKVKIPSPLLSTLMELSPYKILVSLDRSNLLHRAVIGELRVIFEDKLEIVSDNLDIRLDEVYKEYKKEMIEKGDLTKKEVIPSKIIPIGLFNSEENPL